MNFRNRIILVGNGFDISAGLKTGYANFIFALAKKSAINSFESKSSPGDLFTLKFDSKYGNQDEFVKFVNDKASLSSLFDFLKEWGCRVQHKHSFIRHILENYAEANWVDIEKAYYLHLSDNVKKLRRVDFQNRSYQPIALLNDAMDILGHGLSEYVKVEQENLDTNNTIKLNSLIDNIVRPPGNELTINQTLAVNFNYTSAFHKVSRQSTIVGNLGHLHIHGSVDESNHPIVFGYGDDTDENYKDLEMEDVNEILRKIKSFQYHQSKHYRKLLNFINGDSFFDVIVLGHSCGLSDKTMLETIFGHPNCISIKAYHYRGKEEFFDKSISISRHFSDKAMFRERLLHYDPNASFPK